MVDRPQRIETLDELRAYVNQTICEREQLEPGAFEFSERILMRRGRPCGIYFCIYGPRQTRFTAIWETDAHRILFYGAGGERYQRIQLVAGI